MRAAVLVLVAIMAPGCVAWQSSIDDMRTEIEEFQATTKADTANYRRAMLDNLEEFKEFVSKEIVDRAKAWAERLEQQRDIVEEKRKLDTARELDQIKKENEQFTKTVIAEVANNAVAGFLGSPTGGQVVRDLIVNDGRIQDDFDQRVEAAIRESEGSSGIPLSDTQRDLAILAAGAAAYWYRNQTRKKALNGSASPAPS